jgi:hypothetical protein
MSDVRLHLILLFACMVVRFHLKLARDSSRRQSVGLNERGAMSDVGAATQPGPTLCWLPFVLFACLVLARASQQPLLSCFDFVLFLLAIEQEYRWSRGLPNFKAQQTAVWMR